MKQPSATRRRLRIDRLELDLRGISPATAESAARALGPALAQALSPRDAHNAPGDRIDAGRLVTSASIGPRELAAGIARRIAESARKGKP
jgi:hypothetical protein